MSSSSSDETAPRRPAPGFLAGLGGALEAAKSGLRAAGPPKGEGLDVAKMLATEPAAGFADVQRDYFFQASMDRWLDGLAEHTFASECLPIERSEAEAIMHVWRTITSSMEASNPDYAVPIPDALDGLIARVDTLLRDRFPRGAFVKLSTRSPKDSKTIFRRAEAAFHARVASGDVPPAPKSDAEGDDAASALNARLVAMSEEMVKAAIVRTGREAATILLDSARVAEDLAYAFEEGTSAAPITLMVREWDDRMRPQCEFRAFVWDGRLTALGQYWHSLFFPELMDPALRSAVATDIQALFETIRGGLPVPSAMLDIAWLGLAGKSTEPDASSPAKAILVEVNPFMEGLGSFAGSTGLFSYEDDADVLQGRAPFEMRVRTTPEPRAELLSHMSTEWRRVVLGF